jgi:hypothetical protein
MHCLFTGVAVVVLQASAGPPAAIHYGLPHHGSPHMKVTSQFQLISPERAICIYGWTEIDQRIILLHQNQISVLS